MRSYATTKWLIRMVEPFDIYTKKVLRPEYKTVEHIVPRCLFRKMPRFHADPINLCVTESHINSRRGSFRFGDTQYTQSKNVVPYIRNEEIIAYYCRQKKVFYPLVNKGRIARICRYILFKYPFIQESQVFENEDVYQSWLLYPMDMDECFTHLNKLRLSSSAGKRTPGGGDTGAAA